MNRLKVQQKEETKKAECYLKAIENGLATSKLVNSRLLEHEQKIAEIERRLVELIPAIEAGLMSRTSLKKQVSAARTDTDKRQLVDDVVASATVKIDSTKTIDIRDLKPKVGGDQASLPG